jgi:gamma-glutamyltranspeptidase/glutathione hydrolase
MRLAPLSLGFVGLIAAALVQSSVQAPARAQAPTSQAMVVAANPMAVEAGLKVLRAGGSAMDAAVAVQATLGLVEPQSSGLAGGAFLTYYDARTKEVTAYDGRETAPASATPTYFYVNGAPLGRGAVRSGRSTGAPGAMAMLARAHADHGKLAWKDLFGEAIRLAEDGFPVPNRMADAAGRAGPEIQAYVGGKKAGEILRNPAYAATVRALAANPRAINEGPIAQAIVAKVAEPPNGGTLTAADLAGYQPLKKPALCRPYRVYIVCAPPPPSGGIGVLMALGIYENLPIDKYGPRDPEGWYLFAEGQRVMYADRDQYVADPSFVHIPSGLLDANYLKQRAALVGPQSKAYAAGNPPDAVAMGADDTREVAGTSHFVIVDREGNALSITTTVESAFGSNRMAAGMVLNNQLTDFSQTPTDAQGRPIANAVAGGKRPRSSMSPTIVLDRNRNFVMAIGSPGGNSIPAYTLKVIVGVLDWKLPLQEAINLPNVIAQGPGTVAEIDRFAPGVVQGLAAKGIAPRGAAAEGSGLHGILKADGRLIGAADPRREGVARTP